MFRLIEPSSGQFTNHTEGTFSRCAHCGIPQQIIYYQPINLATCFGSSGRFINHIEGTFSRCAQCGIPQQIIYYQPKNLATCFGSSGQFINHTECTFNIVYELTSRWLNEPKHVARFIG